MRPITLHTESIEVDVEDGEFCAKCPVCAVEGIDFPLHTGGVCKRCEAIEESPGRWLAFVRALEKREGVVVCDSCTEAAAAEGRVLFANVYRIPPEVTYKPFDVSDWKAR